MMEQMVKRYQRGKTGAELYHILSEAPCSD